MAAVAKSNHPEYAPAYVKLEPMRETDPFCILEVLTQVLELAGPGAKTTAARVCRRWSDAALNMLWRDLEDITPFLKLFALLKDIDNSYMSPAEMLERIKGYGVRVRTLRCTANNAAIRLRGAGKVYYALGRRELQTFLPMVSIPPSGLFPNLRILEWEAKQVSPHVERTLEAVSYFLSPSLTHISVSGIVQLEDHQGDMHEFYPGPPVDCDPFFRALNALDGLRMESLELRLRKYPEDVTKDHQVGLFLRRHQETLRHFRAWDAGVVTHFQKELWGLSRLRSLDVHTANELQASGFIEGLADGAPGMEFLHLRVGALRPSRDWKGLWNALKRLRKLTILHLEVPQIDALEAEDARSMKEAWPALSCLFIMQTRLGDQTKGLSLEFVRAITHHFSQSLTKLGLYFGTNIRPLRHSFNPVRLEKLRYLEIRLARAVEDFEALGEDFAQILPRQSLLKYKWPCGWYMLLHGWRCETANRPENSTEAETRAIGWTRWFVIKNEPEVWCSAIESVSALVGSVILSNHLPSFSEALNTS